MTLLERIRQNEAAKRAPLDQVRETPARPFPSGATEPSWIRHQRALREAAGGRLVATKEL